MLVKPGELFARSDIPNARSMIGRCGNNSAAIGAKGGAAGRAFGMNPVIGFGAAGSQVPRLEDAPIL